MLYAWLDLQCRRPEGLGLYQIIIIRIFLNYKSLRSPNTASSPPQALLNLHDLPSSFSSKPILPPKPFSPKPTNHLVTPPLLYILNPALHDPNLPSRPTPNRTPHLHPLFTTYSLIPNPNPSEKITSSQHDPPTQKGHTLESAAPSTIPRSQAHIQVLDQKYLAAYVFSVYPTRTTPLVLLTKARLLAKGYCAFPFLIPTYILVYSPILYYLPISPVCIGRLKAGKVCGML